MGSGIEALFCFEVPIFRDKISTLLAEYMSIILLKHAIREAYRKENKHLVLLFSFLLGCLFKFRSNEFYGQLIGLNERTDC
jgi:hypothetical protein